jgi:ketosteroid isomerase-like protein
MTGSRATRVEILTNAQIVTAFFAGGEHGDEAYLADDVEFVPFRRLAGAGSRGPKGFTRYIREIAKQFAEYEVKLDRLRCADDQVVVDVRREARSARCPVPLTDRFAQVLTLRDGKIARIEEYPTFEWALETAGCLRGMADQRSEPVGSLGRSTTLVATAMSNASSLSSAGDAGDA